MNSEDLRLGKGKRPLTLGFLKKKTKNFTAVGNVESWGG